MMRRSAGTTVTVHPHACGEYRDVHPEGAGQSGSSPRVWGIPFARATAGIGHRFIPTRVGNTHLVAPGKDLRPVHPHACGEYFDIIYHQM